MFKIFHIAHMDTHPFKFTSALDKQWFSTESSESCVDFLLCEWRNYLLRPGRGYVSLFRLQPLHRLSSRIIIRRRTPAVIRGTAGVVKTNCRFHDGHPGQPFHDFSESSAMFALVFF